MGLQALAFPADIGGGNADLLTWGLVVEEVARQCDEAAFPLVLTVCTDVARVLYHADRPDIVQRYVIPIITGKCIASFAFSEDTDQFSMRTTLWRSGNKFHLSGEKAYITGGLMSDVLLTYARDESDRLVACLIERDAPGVELNPVSGIGFRTAAMGRLTLRDVVISEDSVVDIDGFGHAQLYLNARRLILACVVTGLVRGVFARCLTRLRDTVRHGQPLIELPNVQASIGRMHIAIESARATVHRTLVRASQGETHPTFDTMISIAKHFLTEQAISVSSQILRLLGGHGYYGDAAYGMYLRDCIGLLSAAYFPVLCALCSRPMRRALHGRIRVP
jgi:alkylation response protein AidB-like acyl-CoA dehydrogenase